MRLPWGISAGVVWLMMGVTACSSQAEPPPVKAAEPPTNVCELVPSAVIAGWALEEVAHESTTDEAQSLAGCSMTGTSIGSPVQLEIDLVFFSGEDRDAARASARAEATRQCDSIASGATGSQEGCRQQGAGEAMAVGVAPLADGVITVRMASASERGETALAADVEAVVGALITLPR